LLDYLKNKLLCSAPPVPKHLPQIPSRLRGGLVWQPDPRSSTWFGACALPAYGRLAPATAPAFLPTPSAVTRVWRGDGTICRQRARARQPDSGDHGRAAQL